MADPRNPLALVPTVGGGRTSIGTPASTDAAKELQTGLAYAPAVNQSNLNYLAMGIPNYQALTQTESGNIGNLLAPTDFTDVQRRGAEAAVGGGFSGSQFGDINTLHMTEEEKIRRQLLGSQLLSGAAHRLPKPFDPTALITGYHRGFGQPGGGVTFRGGPAGGGGAPAPIGGGGGGPLILPGTATPHNFLSDLISRYSPGGGDTPLYNMRSGEGPGAANREYDPVTGQPLPGYNPNEDLGQYYPNYDPSSGSLIGDYNPNEDLADYYG